jgi:hypothetical protein
VLCDDRPELDQLLHRSYFGGDGAAELVACVGSESTEGAESRAYEAFARGDAAGVLGAVEQSRAPSAYLRYLSGGARWQQRQLRAAMAEYDAALGLRPSTDLAATIQAQRQALQQELAPALAADEAARHSVLWAAVAAAALIAAFLVLLARLRRSQ